MIVPRLAASSTGKRVFPGTNPSSTAFSQVAPPSRLPDDHPDAVVAEVQGLTWSLHAVAQNGHRLVLQDLLRLAQGKFLGGDDLLPHIAEFDLCHIILLFCMKTSRKPRPVIIRGLQTPVKPMVCYLTVTLLAEDGDRPRPVHLLHAEGLEVPEDRGGLVLVGRDLHDQGVLVHRDHPAAEDVDRPEDLRAVLFLEAEADEHQFPLDGGRSREIRHGDHVDEFVQLLS